MRSIKIDKSYIADLKKDYQAYIVHSNEKHTAFMAKIQGTIIVAYHTGTVVFQGKDYEFFYDIISKKYLNDMAYTCGSDEVGTGDVFGPIVVCACAIRDKDIYLLKKYNIQDSKKITDKEIREIGPILYRKLSNSLLILKNSKYNDVIKNNNLNKIKAKLHNHAYLNLSKKINLDDYKCYIDQFTPAKNYFDYLSDTKNIYSNLIFATKAESKYPAVACASIIARYCFLVEWDKMCLKYDFMFPKGAGSKVDIALQDFHDNNKHSLAEVAKLNFKNLKKIN
ncbi:MAG: ribonuclease HIII [Erysipelotrichaceae bacterium]